jgi:hypothetical protein
MSKKITLEAWAAPLFDPVPKIKTLRLWARECRIFPRPQKVGRTYYVDPDARYVDHKKRLNYGSKAA